MKYILEFKQYFTKNKLNEGGGAGKEFKFDDISFDTQFEYSKSGLKLISKKVELGEKMDLIGYQDGLSDIAVDGLFEADLDYKMSEESIGKITVGQVIYHVGEGVLFSEYPKETTFKEIVEKGDTIQIQIGGSGSLDYVYGGGYILAGMDTGTEISIPIDRLNGDYSFNDSIDGVDVVGLFSSWSGGKKQENSPFDASFKLKATEKFKELWDALFANPPYYQDYLDDFKEGDEEPMSEEDWWQMIQDDLQMEYGI